MIDVSSNSAALKQAQTYVIGSAQSIVLPSKENPRLLVPFCALRMRWNVSGFYPAFKLKAKLWRVFQRCRVLVGTASTVVVLDNEAVKNFISSFLPGVTHSSVMLGTPGPNRKIIVQLWQEKKMAGYLKVAATASADDKICAEAAVLQILPRGLGPKLIRLGELGGKKAMILSLVEGQMLKAVLPAAPLDGKNQLTEIIDYLSRLMIQGEIFTIDEHPAIVRLRKKMDGIDPRILGLSLSDFDETLDLLRNRSWSLVIEHGDFAPWNVFLQPDGSLIAIDWEEGCVDGFAYFDFIHFVGQTAALCHKWDPSQTMDYLKCVLSPQLGAVTLPIIKLGLLNSYMSLRESVGDEHWIQGWRRRMWEMDL